MPPFEHAEECPSFVFTCRQGRPQRFPGFYTFWLYFIMWRKVLTANKIARARSAEYAYLHNTDRFTYTGPVHSPKRSVAVVQYEERDHV